MVLGFGAFAKRISAQTAKETYLYFEQEDRTTPDAILDAGWDRLCGSSPIQEATQR